MLLPRTKSSIHTLKVTLEEMYNGSKRKLVMSRRKVCDTCLGIGMHWETGTVSNEECTTCLNDKVVPDCSEVYVDVKRGSRNSQKIIYKNGGTQAPDMRPGDLIIILVGVDHNEFKRFEDDLLMIMKIELTESLCGVRRVVKTLDNREILVTSPRGKVLNDNDIMCFPGEGMPKYHNPDEKGNLIIRFELKMPKRLRGTHAPSMEQCLPPRQEDDIPHNAVESNLVSLSCPHLWYE